MSTNRNSQQTPIQRRVPQIPHFISIYDYLATLQPDDLSRLYASQASCLAIFRLLPELSKLIINYWLFTGDDKTIKKDDILLWFSASDQKAGYQALNSILRLGILYPVRIQQENNQEPSTIRPRDNTEFQMHSAFKRNLQNALTDNSDKNNGFGVVHQNPSQDISIEALDTYSKIRWENLLYFMVGTSTNEKPPSSEMLQLLTHSGLMSRSQNSGRYQITHFGFQFLLQDPHVQVWDLLLQYLHFKSDENQMDLLNFYFLLSSLQLGVCYDASNLPDSNKELMNDLKNCGLIYRDKKDRNQYYPTRLATSLGSMKAQNLIGSATILNPNDNSVAAPLSSLNSSSLDSNETDATQDHFIVLETNYNVYAYTSSRLHISILNLFLTLKCRFSNMVIAHLDRQSIRRALSKGITAEQILQYLTAHAHPLMLKRTPVLPVTVVDQIRLWAIEKNRLYDQAATLYRGFSQAADFQNLLNILQKRRPEAILWTNEKKLIIVVSQEGHRIIKNYYQERAKQGQ